MISSDNNISNYFQSEKYGAVDHWEEMFAFLVETMETAIKSWHETSKVDPGVHFLLDKEKTQTDKYAPIVNVDKVVPALTTLVFICIFAMATISLINCSF